MIMLRELPKQLISNTTELLVRPGLSQRCIEEDVSLASEDCLSVILGKLIKSASTAHGASFITSAQTRNAFGMVRLGLGAAGHQASDAWDWTRKFDSVCAPRLTRAAERHLLNIRYLSCLRLGTLKAIVRRLPRKRRRICSGCDIPRRVQYPICFYRLR